MQKQMKTVDQFMNKKPPYPKQKNVFQMEKEMLQSNTGNMTLNENGWLLPNDDYKQEEDYIVKKNDSGFDDFTFQ